MPQKRLFRAGFFALAVILSAAGCSKDDSTTPGNSENLFFSFHTPDWAERIDCTHLDLDATGTGFLSAMSQSTAEQFYLKVPTDSSEWASGSHAKRYAIGSDSLFQFNQTLPITKGSSTRLIGINQFSESSYNEVTSVKYLSSDAEGAYFSLRANYKMIMKVHYSASMDTTRFVYGEYHFKIKTARK